MNMALDAKPEEYVEICCNCGEEIPSYEIQNGTGWCAICEAPICKNCETSCVGTTIDREQVCNQHTEGLTEPEDNPWEDR